MQIASLKCPQCGTRIPVNTAEAKFTFEFLRCMGCAFDEVVESYRKGDTVIEGKWKGFIEQAAAIKVERELKSIPKDISREAIIIMIDDALDKRDFGEFMRLSNLLKGGDAEK